MTKENYIHSFSGLGISPSILSCVEHSHYKEETTLTSQEPVRTNCSIKVLVGGQGKQRTGKSREKTNKWWEEQMEIVYHLSQIHMLQTSQLPITNVSVLEMYNIIEFCMACLDSGFNSRQHQCIQCIETFTCGFTEMEYRNYFPKLRVLWLNSRIWTRVMRSWLLATEGSKGKASRGSCIESLPSELQELSNGFSHQWERQGYERPKRRLIEGEARGDRIKGSFRERRLSMMNFQCMKAATKRSTEHGLLSFRHC